MTTMGRVGLPLVVVLGAVLGGYSLGCTELPGWLWHLQPGAMVSRPSGGAEPAVASGTNLRDRVWELDGDEVLSKVARMPIPEWSVMGQDPALRHLGPAAVDFHLAFGLGDNPERIDPADADGVALRAVQALEARTRAEHENMLDDTQALADESESLVELNAERAAEIATLKAELASLRAEVTALRRGRR
jgi:hypothetical protein